MFTLQLRRFNDRTVAYRWAAERRVEKADRLVLACSRCPVSQRSRRRPMRWDRVAADVGVSARTLRAAVAAERRRL